MFSSQRLFSTRSGFSLYAAFSERMRDASPSASEILRNLYASASFMMRSDSPCAFEMISLAYLSASRISRSRSARAVLISLNAAWTAFGGFTSWNCTATMKTPVFSALSFSWMSILASVCEASFSVVSTSSSSREAMTSRSVDSATSRISFSRAHWSAGRFTTYSSGVPAWYWSTQSISTILLSPVSIFDSSGLSA